MRISSVTMRKGVEWLQKHFHLDVASYDVIVGNRADDSYFAFIRAFLTNQISLSQLSYAMKLGKLGEQIVIMSKKGFDCLQFISYGNVEAAEYYIKRKTRDEKARESYMATLEKDDRNGLYIKNIIDEEVSVDDPRLW